MTQTKEVNSVDLLRTMQTTNGPKIKAIGFALAVNPGDLIGDWGNGGRYSCPKRQGKNDGKAANGNSKKNAG